MILKVDDIDVINVIVIDGGSGMNGFEVDVWDYSGDIGKELLIIYYIQCNLRLIKDNKIMGIRFLIIDKVKQ